MLSPILIGPLKIERLNIAITDLSTSLVGTKITQLSDLHYDGLRLSEDLLTEAIKLSNNEDPDLVLLTGDYITDQPNTIDKLAKHLQYLKSRMGIYAVLGNHDYYHHQAKHLLTEALTNIGIIVLWNEIATPLGDDLPIVGLADFWSQEFNPEPIMNQLPSYIPRLVLSHNPDSAVVLQRWRVDLQLSGHTHGGQINIPCLGPAPILLDKIYQYTPKYLHSWIPFIKTHSRIVKHWQWAQGWHQIQKNQLYVNRGLGTYFPGRLFCSPEVTSITLITQ
ncbi:metallophosphoesterase [Cyanobacterium sp. uoEpiScrs1]|uniref:metallophosphoesterase n=1 Tax=Cyanobacterium sp. uoEpiScrs1 TaxID=2976343 RepID=UPI00226A5136|nr:metallophosphoesterase [Cyanobacterium sp. uoEpiScrs1]